MTADPAVAADVAAWLADLRAWSTAHGLDAAATGCGCDDHDRRLADLMARKGAVLARCAAAETAGAARRST